MDFKSLRKMLSMQPSEPTNNMPAPVSAKQQMGDMQDFANRPAAAPGPYMGEVQANNLNDIMHQMDEQDRPAPQPAAPMSETEEEKFNRIKMMIGK